ncbi:T9SS type A sorting domain-containing protein [Aquimarina rubra]|uniref:T9SS type A sorting domain-containing protein n=1 Tax=Aquimarina rubra TaxID=1920033 RepID=A0ABW5LD40_9FLAO
MKKLILCTATLLVSIIASSQVTNEGSPKSWDLDFLSIEKQGLTAIEMPTFDLKKIQEEDAINDQDKSKVYRFGYEFKVDLGFKNAGIWNQLESGNWIWRIRIKSKNAKTINFVFDNYKLPKGASVYFYNTDKSDLLGAYTDVFNRDDKMLGTWMIEGDDIIVEYFVPALMKGKGELNISKVIHGYRSVTDTELEAKALNDSGNCNQDVDCPVGSDFDSLKDGLKPAVALFILGGGVCSGTLVNNTSNNRNPYFLSANHCFEGTGGTSNPATWAFRFNWVSPNPSCGNTTPSTNGTFDQTTSGATILANNRKSDVLLVNIDTNLPESWNLEWAGWDRTGNAPSFVVGIHHPSGDIMKVCRENVSPTVANSVNIGGLLAPPDTWRVADWDLGVTEGGSSGSAIFDPLGRIIGQLAGGSAFCANGGSGTNDNNQPDFYGRFDVSWDFGTTNSTRLSNWLDPTNTGRTTLNSLSEEIALGVDENELAESTFLYPNPSQGIFNVENKSGSQLTYEVYNMVGQQIKKGEVASENSTIDLSANVNGIYFISMTNTSTNLNTTKKVVVNR